MIFHHFGLATNNRKKSETFLIKSGYKKVSSFLEKKQKVKLSFFKSRGKPTIEVITPLTKKSPITSYLKKFDAMFYHICFEIKKKIDVKKFCNYNNAICVVEPYASTVFKRKKISFFYIKYIGLIEIISK